MFRSDRVNELAKRMNSSQFMKRVGILCKQKAGNRDLFIWNRMNVNLIQEISEFHKKMNADLGKITNKRDMFFFETIERIQLNMSSILD